MNISLLFPPSWHPSQPYLSIPCLSAFLEQSGVPVQEQRDLNIELLDRMLTKDFGLDIHQQLIDLVKKLEQSVDGETGPGSKEHYAKAVESLDRFPHLIDEIERAKGSLRSQEFFDEDRYRESLFVIDRWLDVVSSLYFPTRMTVVDNQLSYSIYSSRDIIKAIHDETQNPYLDLYRRFFLPGFAKNAPDFVGVSITATSQIIPGLTLCRLIKEQFPQVHVTVGGSIFTRLVDNLRRCDRLFEVTDDFIVFEGETALLEMINQLEGRKDFSKVPNLIWRQDGKITVNQPFYSENLAEHPAPNYKGFPLDQYLAPHTVLRFNFHVVAITRIVHFVP